MFEIHETFYYYSRKMKSFLIFLTIYYIGACCWAAEVNSWECNKFNGAKIVSKDGTYLGDIGPSWNTNSIYNSSSRHSTTWSSDSIYNDSSEYGNTYSNESVFNSSASDPPKIIASDGSEIGRLSVGPSWDNSRYDPSDIKYTCDWD